jgi:hypothetical protein
VWSKFQTFSNSDLWEELAKDGGDEDRRQEEGREILFLFIFLLFFFEGEEGKC